MALTAAAKAQIIKAHSRSKNDTGSSEVQIAVLTASIEALTEHLKTHKHDFHTRHGLTNKVSQRTKLMAYLKRTNLSKYRELIEKLGIRG